MSDLVGNSEDQFPRVVAQVVATSQHDCKIVDWNLKPQDKQKSLELFSLVSGDMSYTYSKDFLKKQKDVI